MTLVVGLVCRLPKKGTPAVIVAGDRQFSSPADESGHRISILPGSSVLAAVAGSQGLASDVVDNLRELFGRSLNVSEPFLSCERFDVLVRRVVEPGLRRFVRANEDAVKESGFGLILATSDAEDVRLYAARSDGVPFRVDHGPGYGCVGREYAGSGALRFSQFRTEHLAPNRAGRLVAFMVLAVSMVDSRVGREPEIFQTVGGLAKPWDNDALRGTKERIHGWDEDLSRYRGWLELGVTDYGTAALDSFMRKRPFGVPTDAFGAGGAESPMDYPQSPT